MSDEDATAKVEVKGGKVRTILQVGSLAILSFIGGYVTLWADQHNDGRYVSKEEYKKDRESDERLNSEIVKNINWRADLTDKKLDGLSEDIKALTRRYSVK